jgi:hypothetical protein
MKISMGAYQTKFRACDGTPQRWRARKKWPTKLFNRALIGILMKSHAVVSQISGINHQQNSLGLSPALQQAGKRGNVESE